MIWRYYHICKRRMWIEKKKNTYACVYIVHLVVIHSIVIVILLGYHHGSKQIMLNLVRMLVWIDTESLNSTPQWIRLPSNNNMFSADQFVLTELKYSYLTRLIHSDLIYTNKSNTHVIRESIVWDYFKRISSNVSWFQIVTCIFICDVADRSRSIQSLISWSIFQLYNLDCLKLHIGIHWWASYF